MTAEIAALLALTVPIATACAAYGLLRGRVDQNRADIVRLHDEKASKESLEGLRAYLDERFRRIEDLIRGRETSGVYPRAPGGE